MLIEKLQTYGVDEQAGFIDHLFGQSQIVAINNVKSNKANLLQGSARLDFRALVVYGALQ